MVTTQLYQNLLTCQHHRPQHKLCRHLLHPCERFLPPLETWLRFSMATYRQNSWSSRRIPSTSSVRVQQLIRSAARIPEALTSVIRLSRVALRRQPAFILDIMPTRSKEIGIAKVCIVVTLIVYGTCTGSNNPLVLCLGPSVSGGLFSVVLKGAGPMASASNDFATFHFSNV